MLVLGVAVLSYPFASNLQNQIIQNGISEQQVEVVEQTSVEDLSAELAEAQAYNEALFESGVVVTDPFDASAVNADVGSYDSLLNLVGDGVMGQLYIPSINVSLPIYHGTSDDVLRQGVGHLEGSSLPVGGASTHAVLTGHTGLPTARIFDALDELEVGDYFIVEVLGEDLAYEVYDIEVVLPDEMDSLRIQEGEDLVTLVTCTPYGVNTHRLLVHAERCDVPQEWLDAQAEEDSPLAAAASALDVPLRLLLAGIAALVALAVLIAIVVHAVRTWRRKASHVPQHSK